MQILFIGNFDVSFSTESHHKKTYEKLGHKVITIQENKTTTKKILEHIDNIDLLIHTHTHGWNIPNIEHVYRICKEKGISTAGYHLDLWKGIKREADLDTDPYWNIEHFFTVDPQFIPDLESRGIKAHFLPAGVLEDECYIAQPNRKKYPHDVIFVGSKGYHEEWNYRPRLIEFLQKTYGSRFGHYGGDGLGTVRGASLNQLYASARIVIGDTLCKGFRYEGYSSDRFWETIGRGGFLIYPRIKNLPTRCTEDRDYVAYTFGDFQELETKIDYYLDNERERETIRKNGYKIVSENETYTQRLQELINTIQK